MHKILTEDQKKFISAAQNGDKHIIASLLKKNIDINTQDEHGYTALMHAVEAGNFNTVKLLLKNDCDLKIKNNEGHTPLMLAALSYDLAIIKLLIKHGADVNTQYKHNETLLMRAAMQSDVELVTLLLKSGADVNMKSNFDSTALMRASNTRKNVDIVRLLLKHGAHINAQDTYGLTPLIHAVLINDLEIVDLLLKHGANIHAKSKHNETALKLALLLGNSDIVKMLIKNGATIDKKNPENTIQHSRTLHNKVIDALGNVPFEDFIEQFIADLDKTILTLSQDHIDNIIRDLHHEPEVLQLLLIEVKNKRNEYFHKQYNYFDYTALRPLACWIILIIIPICILHYLTNYHYLPLIQKRAYLIEQLQLLTSFAKGKTEPTLSDILDIRNIGDHIQIIDSNLRNSFATCARTIIIIIIILLLKPVFDHMKKFMWPQYKKRYKQYCILEQKIQNTLDNLS